MLLFACKTRTFFVLTGQAIGPGLNIMQFWSCNSGHAILLIQLLIMQNWSRNPGHVILLMQSCSYIPGHAILVMQSCSCNPDHVILVTQSWSCNPCDTSCYSGHSVSWLDNSGHAILVMQSWSCNGGSSQSHYDAVMQVKDTKKDVRDMYLHHMNTYSM